MIVFNAIYFCCCVFALATAISSEVIFSGIVDKFKRWPQLYYFLTCNKCLSFWIGMLISALWFNIHTPVLDGLFAYTFTYTLNLVFDMFESKITISGDAT